MLCFLIFAVFRLWVPDHKHMGPPEARALWAGEEGPTLSEIESESETNPTHCTFK